MSARVESLEPRSLFSLTGLPSSIQFAYDALIVDGTNLKAAVADLHKTFAADQKAIGADVKLLGRSATNTALLRQVEAASAKEVNALSAAVTRYEAAAKPVYNKMALADAYFSLTPSAGLSNRLAAAQASLAKVQGKPYGTLVTAATNGPAPYSVALTALAAANPTDALLAADVQSATNNLSTLSATDNALVTKIQTDAATLSDAG